MTARRWSGRAVPRDRRTTTVVAALLVAAVVAGSVVALLWFAPFFRVQDVDYRTTPPRMAALQEAAPVTEGDPLVQVDTDGLRDAVLATRLFSTAEVSRSWPSTLIVEATPRAPVVAVTGTGVSGYELVDETGTVFESVRTVPQGVPVARADDPSDPAAMRALAALVTGLSPELVSTMDDLAVDGRGHMSMEVAGVLVNWGDATENRLKAAVVRDLVTRADVARIDVSAPMAPVTSDQREVAGAPAMPGPTAPTSSSSPSPGPGEGSAGAAPSPTATATGGSTTGPTGQEGPAGTASPTPTAETTTD